MYCIIDVVIKLNAIFIRVFFILVMLEMFLPF